MLGHCPLGFLPQTSWDGQRIPHADTSDPKNVIDCFDIAFDSSSDLVGWCRNLAHFQCACKGAEQSSTDGAHHVIKGRRYILFGFNTIEGFNPTVHAESDRGIKPFKKRLTRWPLDPFNSKTTSVNNFSHNKLLI